MPKKPPQMWQREKTGHWYVTLRGKQIPLGQDFDAAQVEYGRLLASSGMDESSDITLMRLWNAFWRNDSTFRTVATKDGYAWLDRKLPEFFPTALVSDIKPFQITEFLAHCDITTDASVDKALKQISRLFNWGRKNGYCDNNPARHIERPTLTPREVFLRPDQLRKFVYGIKNADARIVGRFMLETGARVVEVRQIAAEHVVLKENRVIFPYQDSKGKKRKRVIYLNAEAKLIVVDQMKQNPTGPLFRNTEGNPWSSRALNYHLRRSGQAMELDFHVCGTILRHSFAYLRLSNGQDVATVSKLLGHNTTEMVMKVYGHLCEGPILEHAAQAVRIPGLRYHELEDTTWSTK